MHQRRSCPARRKLRWPAWFALVLMLAIISLLGLRQASPQVVFLPQPEPKPTRLQMAFENGWLWLQSHFGGPKRSVLVRAKVLGFAHPPVPDQALGPATATAGNVQAWLLSDGDLRRISRLLDQSPELQFVSQPGIQTWSRMRGLMTAGNDVMIDGKREFSGLQLDSLPIIHDDCIELSSTLQYTEALTNENGRPLLQTNLAVRTRIQIRKGGGALLLSRERNGKSMAVILSAVVQ